MPIIILVGIRFGLFTDSEAAAVVAVYALVIGFCVYRDLKIGQLGEVFYHAGRTTAVVLFLLAAAGPFSWLVSESQIAARSEERRVGQECGSTCRSWGSPGM